MSTAAANMRARCRASGSADLRTVLDFGATPLADQLIAPEDLGREDALYPLRLVFCPESALVQITADVPPEILWNSNYPYYTSVNPGLVQHFTEAASQMLARKHLGKDALVIEAASNDGYQLAVFHNRGARVLGIDPASGPVQVANTKGIETLCRLFDEKLARELESQGLHADLLTGNNVLNLIPDPNDFVRAAKRLLKPDGMMVLELPYLVDTIDQGAFDNVFHQNTTYWTATSLDRLLRRHGLYLTDVEKIPTFGGSLRVYVERVDRPSEAVRALLAGELTRGVDTFEFYAEFAERVEAIKRKLRSRLRELREQGQRIVAYGAAGGMATTLLAYLDLPPNLLEYAVDISPHKHGKCTAGYRLEIHPPERLVEDRPEVVLLLAWNFAEAILAANKDYVDTGGRFLIPIPEPRLV